ncbi:hypothetical protein DIS24_g10299 [Lasiodiplodia hormozganensis]|uniref:Uncharacterized protein n=1 Tax=Lasiodiplodia hormozganensis TaxID=869390 RepID=A0AA40CGU6_9PEZI|nr:hypothetical protein DIS24_g10299 [Lasiodiplodia hormozganensis]
MKFHLFFLAASISCASAQTHTTTITENSTTTTAIPTPPSTITKWYLNRLDFWAYPEASIVHINASDMSATTYLINCPTPNTATTTSSPSTSSTPPDDCNLPSTGMTLVEGPDTMRYTSTNTAPGSSSTITEDCTIWWEKQKWWCSWNKEGDDVPQTASTGSTTYTSDPPSSSYNAMQVTAGIEKIEAASSSSSQMKWSSLNGLIPKTTSSSAGAAAATGAPMDVIPAMGLAGAVGALAAAVAL